MKCHKYQMDVRDGSMIARGDTMAGTTITVVTTATINHGCDICKGPIVMIEDTI